MQLLSSSKGSFEEGGHKFEMKPVSFHVCVCVSGPVHGPKPKLMEVEYTQGGVSIKLR